VAIFESTKGSLRLIFLAVLFISAHLNSFWATAAYTLTPLIIFILGFMTISKTFFKAKITPDVITKLIHFSKWLFIWEATATFHSRIDVLMLARFKTSFDVGIYSVASGIIVGFIWLISAFSNVLAPKLSQIQTQTQFVKIIKKSLIGVSVIFFFIVLSFIFAKPIIILLFSSVYEKSIPAFQILCLGIAFFSLNTPFMSSLYAIGKSKSIALLSIFQLFLLILFNLFTIPAFGILGPAITFAAVNLIILLMTIYLIFIPFKKGTLFSR
jgi:O-antigen/teichoic acid export membrane protein